MSRYYAAHIKDIKEFKKNKDNTQITLKDCLTVACNTFNVCVSKVYTKNIISGSYSNAKLLYYALAYLNTKHTQKEVVNHINRKQHSNVTRAIQIIKTNNSFKELYNKALSKLYAKEFAPVKYKLNKIFAYTCNFNNTYYEASMKKLRKCELVKTRHLFTCVCLRLNIEPKKIYSFLNHSKNIIYSAKERERNNKKFLNQVDCIVKNINDNIYDYS